MSKFTNLAVIVPVFFASCSMDAVKSTASSTTNSIKHFSLSDLRPNKVDVVEVREKDLRDLPLGKERALAFEQKQKRTFWSYIKFQEPDLPVFGPEDFDGSLLPPKDF